MREIWGMMKPMVLAITAVVALGACSGGGSSTSTSGTTLTGHVVGSYVNGVSVCVDGTNNCDVSSGQGDFTLPNGMGQQLSVQLANAKVGTVSKTQAVSNVNISADMLSGGDSAKAQRILALFHQAGVKTATGAEELYDLSGIKESDISLSDLANFLNGLVPKLDVGQRTVATGTACTPDQISMVPKIIGSLTNQTWKVTSTCAAPINGMICFNGGSQSVCDSNYLNTQTSNSEPVANLTSTFAVDFFLPSNATQAVLIYCVNGTLSMTAPHRCSDGSTPLTAVGSTTVSSSSSASTQNGVCGSSNGGTFTAAPTSNLCSQGTAGSVSGSGPWAWSCAGLNGGSTASCSATRSSSTSYTYAWFNSNCSSASCAYFFQGKYQSSTGPFCSMNDCTAWATKYNLTTSGCSTTKAYTQLSGSPVNGRCAQNGSDF